MQESAPTHRLIPISELKNDTPQRVTTTDRNILLCMVNGTVYAVDDLCTHDDISLSLGVLCEHRLRCPLHGSEFDIRSGKVLNEPADIDLVTYETEVTDGWVCLKKNLDAY